MILVADANVLVGELLRHRGQDLIADGRLEIYASERAWHEAHYELRRRAEVRVRRGQVTESTAAALTERAWNIAVTSVTVISEEAYQFLETMSRARIPSDLDDWHTVALALLLNAAIWTNDGDFLGCGCATWVTETLLAELAATNP